MYSPAGMQTPATLPAMPVQPDMHGNMGHSPIPQMNGTGMNMNMANQHLPMGHNGLMPPMSHMGGSLNLRGMRQMNGGLNGGFHPAQSHHRHNPSPAYNPHQHVHYPYQPQPLSINPQTTRGMPYTGPGLNHFLPGPSPMNGMPHPSHQHQSRYLPPGPTPLSVHNTGMSGMSGVSGLSGMSAMSPMSSLPSGYHSHRGMTSPMPMGLSPGPHIPQGPFGQQPNQPHIPISLSISMDLARECRLCSCLPPPVACKLAWTAICHRHTMRRVISARIRRNCKRTTE